MRKLERALELVDSIICQIIKADKYEGLVNKLQSILNTTWFDTQNRAVNEAIDNFLRSEGEIGEDDKKELFEILNKRLGFEVAQAMQSQMSNVRAKTYHSSIGDVDVSFGFNRTSKDVLSWLESNHSYWIGNYYKEQLSEKLGANVSDVFKKIATDGMSREAAGRYAKETLKNFFEKPEGYKGSIKNYFEGFSNHVITQTREFAKIDAYERAGIKAVRIVAVLDHRTSKICRHMHGRIISVSKLKEQRDKILSETTPEEAKKYSLWLSDKQADEKVKNVKTNKLSKYLGMPPYHFFCRTSTEMVDDEDLLVNEKSFGDNVSGDDKKILDSYSSQEYAGILDYIKRQSRASGLEYDKEKITNDLTQYSNNPFSIITETELTVLANEVITKSKMYGARVDNDDILFLFMNNEGIASVDKSFLINFFRKFADVESAKRFLEAYKSGILTLE